MKKDITALFCFVDDFANLFDAEVIKRALESGVKHRRPTRIPGLADSEIATIILLFQQASIRNFKHFYELYLKPLYREDFPQLPTYERFVALMPRVLGKFVALLNFVLSPHYQMGYVDATSLAVCDKKRIASNKVFKGFASIGKTTKGWFLGMKLHLLINEAGTAAS